MVGLAVLALVAAGCAKGSDAGNAAAGPSSTAASLTTGTTPGSPVPARTSASKGCTAPAAVAPGESEIHLDAGGADRWYLRHVPTGYTGAAMPLVIDIHGYAEGATFHSQVSGLGAYGDSHGFITITPNGQGTPVHWDANIGSGDVNLIGTILDQAESQLCVDTNRVYVAGFSNGAFMSSAVACQYSDRVAAVAPVAGMRDIPGCTFTRPVPVVTFHGTADEFVRYQGGMGSGAAKLPAPDGSGRTLGELGADSAANAAIVPGSMDEKMPDITTAWATRNGCQATPTESKVTNDVTLVAFPCPTGHEVQLYRVTDGGHAWPGSAGSAAIGAVTGRTTMTINATQLIWDFFAAHSLQPAS